MRQRERFENNRKRDVSHLEVSLRNLLQPVEPREKFVEELRLRLLNRSMSPVKSRIFSWARNPFVLVSGFVGGVIVILMGIRAILSIAGMISLMIYRANKNLKKTPQVAVGQTSN